MSASSLHALARIALALLLAIAVAAFLFLVHFELVHFAGRATHIDESYFAACAARGVDSGLLPIAACHDNKAPLIFLLYETAFALTGIYNFTAIKLLAYAVVLLNVALVAAIAGRLAGIAGATVAASLLLSALTADDGNLALKTELVGGLFVIAALGILSAPDAAGSFARLALAGLLVGLAVVTKQPFAFAGFAIILWLYLSAPGRFRARLGPFLARSLWFGCFVLVPFLLFWAAFARQGTAADFIDSFFLYPAVYGGGPGGSPAALLRRAGAMAAGFADYAVLVGAAAAAVAFLLSQANAQGSARFGDPRWLFVIVTLFLFASFVATPEWLPYYVVLVAAPLALLTGTVFGDLWRQGARAAPRFALVALAALNAGAGISAARTWHSNGGHLDAVTDEIAPGSFHPDPSARYAYQLERYPSFYTDFKLIPASTLQFPWALPEVPDSWNYTQPPAGTLVRGWLDEAQARHLAQLYADFARTPPSYILLQTERVRAQNSPNVVDIPGFQDYLDRHCRALPPPQLLSPSVLYRCTANPG